MTSIVDRIVEALSAPAPETCVWHDATAERGDRQVPSHLRGLIVLYLQLREQHAHLLQEPSGGHGDGGVTIRRGTQAEAVRTLIQEAIREDDDLSLRHAIELRPGFTYHAFPT